MSEGEQFLRQDEVISIITKAINFHRKRGEMMLASGARNGSAFSIIKGHLHEVMATSLSEARYLYEYFSEEDEEFLQSDGSYLKEMQECDYFNDTVMAIIKFAKIDDK
ncbi:hypothetical protein ISO77_11190 [Morganella morganii subsp. morganii]|uniref:hypothetical protein n=1 Tax=Morganella morganii TaxID=582 RepID=UPI001BD94389|nr:hypothetical protein [Morganella morganii]MBT0396094.1 hypothetical protein [Morganella morganii subsp. morganii]